MRYIIHNDDFVAKKMYNKIFIEHCATDREWGKAVYYTFKDIRETN